MVESEVQRQDIRLYMLLAGREYINGSSYYGCWHCNDLSFIPN